MRRVMNTKGTNPSPIQSGPMHMHTVQLEEKDNQGNLLLMNLSVSTVTIAALTIATVSSSTTPRPSRPTAQSCM